VYAELAITDRAESYAVAWLAGRWDEIITRHQSLASIVSEQLCDVPGNEFRAVLEVVRRAARAGDAHAQALIERMAKDHAETVHERRGYL
jgi:transposase